MRRRRRHVRHVVLRLQLPADRLRATAGAEGDLRDLRHRRPLDRRRALARRRAAPGRPRRLLPLHDADVRAAARAGDLGRGLAGRVAAPARGERALGADLAARERARRLLAPRVGAARGRRRRLRADRLPDDAGGRLGRRLPQQLVPHRGRARRQRRAAPAARRAVGARRPDARHAGSADRPRHRDGGVVRPVAARADRACRDLPLRRVRPLLDPARAGPRPARGPVAAAALGPADHALGRGARRPAVAGRPARPRHRRVDRLRRPPAVGPVDRPAPRRRPVPDLGLRRAARTRPSATPG